MRPRVVVPVLVIAAACCGGSRATTTGSSSSGASSSSSGSAGGATFATGASASTCGLLGAGGRAGAGGASAACAAAPTGVSYAKDIVPIFTACGGDSCHHGAWTYAATVGKPTSQCCDGRFFIAPGDPERSYIIDKLEGRTCAGTLPMPQPPDVITSQQKLQLIGWICEGAPNN